MHRERVDRERNTASHPGYSRYSTACSSRPAPTTPARARDSHCVCPASASSPGGDCPHSTAILVLSIRPAFPRVARSRNPRPSRPTRIDQSGECRRLCSSSTSRLIVRSTADAIHPPHESLLSSSDWQRLARHIRVSLRRRYFLYLAVATIVE